MNALEKAVKRAGSQAELARALKISPQRLVYWRKPGNRVPAEQCAAIERATGISRHDLRPDIFGKAPKERATP